VSAKPTNAPAARHTTISPQDTRHNNITTPRSSSSTGFAIQNTVLLDLKCATYFGRSRVEPLPVILALGATRIRQYTEFLLRIAVSLRGRAFVHVSVIGRDPGFCQMSKSLLHSSQRLSQQRIFWEERKPNSELIEILYILYHSLSPGPRFSPSPVWVEQLVGSTWP
jgi:hypothetical protein